MADNNTNQQPQTDPSPAQLGEGAGSTESLGTLSPPTVDYDSEYVRFR